MAGAFGQREPTPPPPPAPALQEAFVTVFGEATTDTQFTTYNQFLSCNGPADIAAAYNWNGIVAAGRTAEPVADACQGDSGGPLAVADSGSSVGYSLVGVVSHGFGCAQLYSPGFYAAVADKVTWIQAVIAGTSGVSLCNGINCGPNAECVSSSCSCKTGFSALTSNWRGEECLRWLSTRCLLLSEGPYKRMHCIKRQAVAPTNGGRAFFSGQPNHSFFFLRKVPPTALGSPSSAVGYPPTAVGCPSSAVHLSA